MTLLENRITSLDTPCDFRPIGPNSPGLSSRRVPSGTEVARQEGDDRFRLVLDLAQVAVWTWSAVSDTLEWSGPVGEMFGATAQELNSYIAFRERVHPEDRDRCQAIWSQARESGRPAAAEYRFWDVSRREYRWYLGRAVPGKNATGSEARWFGTCTDIHELQTTDARLSESERILRKREQQLSMLFEMGTMGDWHWDISKGEVRAHRTVWALFGAPDKDDSAPISWFVTRLHPQDKEAIDRELQTAVEGDRTIDVEFRVVRPDSSVRWISVRAVLLRDARGVPVQAHGLILDITERKTAELQVEESERQLREQADAMRQIAWASKANGSVSYYNYRWHEYTGDSSATIQDWFSESFVHPDDAGSCAQTATQGFAHGTAFEVELRLKRHDRSYRWHLVRCFPYRDQYGRLVRWFGTGTDIHEQKTQTERLEAEVQARTEELRRSLTEIETLLKEVHHRVKNNLQVISSLLWMQSETLEDPTAAAALRESQQRVFSMALIHERLYGSKQMDEVDFAEYAQTLIHELFYSYSGTAGTVSTNLNLARVSLKIDQAIPCGLILNELVTNALKYAYPDGRSGEISVVLGIDAADEVTLSVSDRGVGLPEGLDWKNSKSLGLPIVDLLSKQIGGMLTVHGKPGAAFTVRFPKEEISSTRAAFTS